MEITLKGKARPLKYGYRALMIFEALKGETYQGGGLQDVLILFYACLLAADRNLDLKFEEFLDSLDEDPLAVQKFSEYLDNVISIQNKLLSKQEDAEEEEKKAQAQED